MIGNNNNGQNSHRNHQQRNKYRNGGSRNSGSRRGHYNPKRGGPGVMLVCETGREHKCMREGLEILRHYLYEKPTADDNEKGKSGLSLEEEIAMLRGGASVDQVLQQEDDKGSAGKDQGKAARAPFTVYETGCRGIVFVMCTLPRCALIPEISFLSEKKRRREDSINVEQNDKGSLVEEGTADSSKDVQQDSIEEEAKRMSKKQNVARQDLQAEITNSSTRKILDNELPNFTPTEAENCTAQTPPWDPIDTVRRILACPNYVVNDDTFKQMAVISSAPSSRFVTRMVPIQATCFASMNEIQHTAQLLLAKYLHPVLTNNSCNGISPTFKIDFRRRNCSHVGRDEVIDALATMVLDLRSSTNKFAVNLSDPDYTIQVEICKTLCGMSVVPNCKSFHNFNLFEIRQLQRRQEIEATG